MPCWPRCCAGALTWCAASPPILARFSSVGAGVIGGFGVALAIAAFISPFASALPDGLEDAANRLGFAGRARRRPGRRRSRTTWGPSGLRRRWPRPRQASSGPWLRGHRVGRQPGVRQRVMRPTGREGSTLALRPRAGAGAALAPAGLHGRPVPVWSWAILDRRLHDFDVGTSARRAIAVVDALRRVSWLLPAILMLTVPAALIAPAGSRLPVRPGARRPGLCVGLDGRGGGHLARPERTGACGPRVARARAPGRRVRSHAGEPDHRAPPGAGHAAGPRSSPAGVRRLERSHDEADRNGSGFGRLVASLLLRSLERAEAVEQARRARGGLS